MLLKTLYSMLEAENQLLLFSDTRNFLFFWISHTDLKSFIWGFLEFLYLSTETRFKI